MINKLEANGKHGVRLPLKEREAYRHINMLGELLDKKMISSKCHEEKVKEIDSRSLDEKTYREFCDVLQY